MKSAVFSALVAGAVARKSEVLSMEETLKLGVVWRGNSSEQSSHLMLEAPQDMPREFTWCNKDGKNYCTMSRNQHIPQYCGSCWAHGAISALGDRVKIARGAQGVDVNLAVQHVLNCGGVGSCHGGSIDGTYQWIHSISKNTGSGVSYETSNPYIACSSESREGFCPHANTKCNALNVARTCGSFDKEGGACTGLSAYPNVTVSEYGSISGRDAMMKEIYNRGPIACGIDAMPLLNFESGIATDRGSGVDHVISVVGWGEDKASNQQYWIVRNSWGEYWGEMGYVRVAFGALQVESQCSWAVPGSYTAIEKDNQVHCHEGGDNCKAAPGPSPGPHKGCGVCCLLKLKSGRCEGCSCDSLQSEEPETTSGTIKLTYSDCGDSSTHGHISKIQPTEVSLGTKTTIKGTGAVDEAIKGATYSVVAKVGPIPVFSHTGDACKPDTMKLPAGAGTITVKGFNCPISKGNVELDLDLDLAASIPAKLARAAVDLTAKTSTGDKALCVKLTIAPESDVVV